MEEFVQNCESCPYCKQSYYEYDTGYAEYTCLLCEELGVDDMCGDDICPLSFKYKLEDKK